jgi:hypothetical protein
MRLKVHGGTPLHGESSVCATCRNARITRGHALNEELVICRASHVHAERVPQQAMRDEEDEVPSHAGEVASRQLARRPGQC